MSTIRILILGDTHGNTAATVHAIQKAKLHDATHIVQCGDFGLWTHFANGIKFLDDLEAELRKHNIQFVWLDGNHEDFDALQAFMYSTYQTDKGFYPIRTHILYSPRNNAWTWDNKRFMTLGGAVSIDRRNRKPGITWWEQENIKDSDVANAFSVIERDRNRDKPVDYFFSHDCSDKTPFYDRLKPDIDSKINRQKMDRVLDFMRPRFHFHGHMHTKYDWQRPIIKDGELFATTQVYGLECDGMFWNWGILDTEIDSFEFAPPTPSEIKVKIQATLSEFDDDF